MSQVHRFWFTDSAAVYLASAFALLASLAVALSAAPTGDAVEIASERWRIAPAAALTHESDLYEQIEAVRRGKLDVIRMSTRPVTKDEFAQLAILPGLRTLQLDAGRITDEDFRRIRMHAEANNVRPFPQLEQLRLRESPIADEAARELATMRSLRIVNVPQSRMTDRGIEHLVQLPNLELLRFGSPHITDDGMRRLRDAPNLRFLHIVSAPITDAGLMHMAEMHKLESLYIDHAHVTDGGLSDLIRKRPNVHLHIHQRHADSDPRAQLPHGH